jgi:hypothetical protein
MLKIAQISPVHISFEKGMPAWVHEGILYDMDPDKQGLRECQIVGLSSYAEQTLTAQILIKEDGAGFNTVWSDVPLHLLFNENSKPKVCLTLQDLVYYENPDIHITFTYYPDLARGPTWAFLKQRSEWQRGTYLGTIDWYQDNLNAHLISLDNGHFACLPQHKIQFNRETCPQQDLPAYRKTRQAWGLEAE